VSAPLPAAFQGSLVIDIASQGPDHDVWKISLLYRAVASLRSCMSVAYSFRQTVRAL
jgi:hypothetical protein